MNQLTPYTGGDLSTLGPLPGRAVQKLQQGGGIKDHFTEGVGNPMDILSIKGKNFGIRIKGEPIDPRARPIYELDVVILDATSNISKNFYKKQFQDGDMVPPDCWSLNGIKPDPQSPDIQSNTCRGCRWNVFGSRVSVDPAHPSKSKACADSRRLAVLGGWLLAPTDGSDPDPMFMRVPATSLTPLRDFAVGLEKNGIPVNAVMVRLGFQAGVAHPVLTFAVVRVLTDAEYDHVEYLLRADDVGAYADERVRRILESPPPAEEIDPSEVAGETITNRNDAPKAPEPAATAPGTTGWKPGQPPVPTAGVGVAQAAQPPKPTPPVAAGIIQLPDGRLFNPATGQYVEPAPAAPEEPPPGAVKLPDGKWFVPSTNSFWEPTGNAAQPEPPEPEGPPEGSITLPDGKVFVPATGQYWEPAGAVGAGMAPNAAARGAGAAPTGPGSAGAPVGAPKTGGGWKPATAQPTVGAGFNPATDVPKFLHGDKSVQPNGPVIEHDPNEGQPAQEAAQPKRRKPPVAPSADKAAAPQQASAELDSLLSELQLPK